MHLTPPPHLLSFVQVQTRSQATASGGATGLRGMAKPLARHWHRDWLKHTNRLKTSERRKEGGYQGRVCRGPGGPLLIYRGNKS